MAQVTTMGIDIAKNVVFVHGVDTHGHVVVTKRLARQKVLPFVAQLSPCLIGMEASGGAHYWAREFIANLNRLQVFRRARGDAPRLREKATASDENGTRRKMRGTLSQRRTQICG